MMREIPSSREAENYVLGSVLIENRYAAELVSRLDHTDFYYKENANIMSAIIELDKARKEIDVSSIIDHLREKKLLEATGGTEYLFELMDAIPQSSMWKHTSKSLRKSPFNGNFSIRFRTFPTRFSKTNYPSMI